MKWLDKLPWLIVIVSVATMGLAPFTPQPHVWEKLGMLMAGTLSQPVDIGDLILHISPWLLLVLKSIRQIKIGI